MAINFKKIWQGLTVVPKTSSTSDSKGELEVIDSTGKLNYHNGTSVSPVLTEAHTATVTNKSIDADTNTITNIENADIKAAAAIDATKIANGTVSNTEFQFLDGVSSSIQTQLNGKLTGPGSSTDNAIARFDGVTGNLLQDSAVFVTDTGRLGVGTTGPAAAIHVQGTDSTTSNVRLQRNSDDVTAPSVTFVKARTAGYPNASDELLRIVAQSTDGSGVGASVATTLIQSNATEAQSAVAGGRELRLSTVENGGTTVTERVRIANNGEISLGQGGAPLAAVDIAKNITGSTSEIGTYLRGAIQSDVTGAAYVIRSSPTTQAAAFTLPTLHHFTVIPGTFGAGSTVTNQIGFNVQSTMTGATNNYGFHSGLAANATTWAFYGAGTAKSYFGGQVGIGPGTTTPAQMLHVADTGSASEVGMRIQNSEGYIELMTDGDEGILRTVAANGALNYTTNGTGSHIFNPSSDRSVGKSLIVRGSEIRLESETNSAGYIQYVNGNSASGRMIMFRANGTVSAPTVVTTGQTLARVGFGGYDGSAYQESAAMYGFTTENWGVGSEGTALGFYTTTNATASSTEKFRIDHDGQVGMGTTAPIANFDLNKTITGSTSEIAFYSRGTVQSDVTTTAHIIRASPSTQATAFNLTDLIYFSAVQGTIGAGSTVTNQHGFLVNSAMTGATNNYGFRSNLAAASGRWNFYAAGTAANYFAGQTSIGTTSPSASALFQVDSTTQGLLPPRMTTAQRDAISSPAAGLVIYNTTTNKLNVYTTAWNEVTSQTTTLPAVLTDEKTSGTAGGTFTSGSYQTRTLNTEVDPGGIVTLAANQFTLAAGSYYLEAEAPAFVVSSHKAILYNVTDAVTTLVGTVEVSPTGTSVTTTSTAAGYFTIAGSKDFEIRHRCQVTRATDGFGSPATFGDAEVYTRVTIWKLA